MSYPRVIDFVSPLIIIVATLDEIERLYCVSLPKPSLYE